MVSSVLAQAILNTDVPDIVGSYREGEEIARQQKVRELSGQALAGEGIDPLLGEIAPEVALALGEQLRARSAKDISDFLRDAGIARAKLQAGDVQGALQFGMQRRNAIKLRGGDTTQTDEFIQAVRQSPEGALDQLNALFGSLDQAKTAKVQEFEFLTEGLTPEQVQQARLKELGIGPDGGISASEREKIAIEREKLRLRELESQERKRQFEAKAGELKPGVQRILDKSQTASVEAGARARQLGLLADDLERAGDIGAGATTRFSEFLKTQLGTQDDVTELRRRFNAIRSSEAVQNLPPGVASDKDIELALKGFPREDAPKSQLISFLRGSQKLAEFQREFNEIKSELISETGSTRGLIKRLKDRLPSSVPQQAPAPQPPTQVLQFDAQGNLIQ